MLCESVRSVLNESLVLYTVYVHVQCFLVAERTCDRCSVTVENDQLLTDDINPLPRFHSDKTIIYLYQKASENSGWREHGQVVCSQMTYNVITLLSILFVCGV